MAETWSRKKRGKIAQTAPHSRVDALAAHRVLRDCYRARTKFAKATTAIDRRLWWVLCITLLRITGHVLTKVDGKRSMYMENAIRNIYRAWKADPRRHLIFHEFIEKSRNEILKEYEIDPAIAVTPQGHDDLLGAEAEHGALDDLPSLLLIGDEAFRPEEAVDRALR